MNLIKICFISLKSYPLFVKRSTDYFGGAEMQISILAKELSKDKNFIVSLITGDYGQPQVIKKGRLTLYKTKIFDFIRVLKKIDADIYVERTINPKVFLVGLWCHLFKKKFIYMVAHDWDCSNYVLKLANLIVTQHQNQNLAIKRNLKLNSLIMPSVIKNNDDKKIGKRQHILWVGRADDWKKPLDYLNLASCYPEEKFVMVCRSGKNKKLFNRIKTKVNSLSNVKFLPAVAQEKILNYFLKAKVLVNTSSAEGFPNTFLQAGITKTPVVSFKVNPNNYLNKYRCGLVGKNKFGKILNYPNRLRTMGKKHYKYVKNITV